MSNEESLSEKTKIPLHWAISIMVSIAGVIGSASVGHYRLGALEEKFSEYKQDRKEHETSDRLQELRIQRLEDSLSSIKDTLVRIEKKLDEP